MTNSELTIFSAFHSQESKQLLDFNWKATNKLNPKKNWKWIVADNTRSGGDEIKKTATYSIIDGVERPTKYIEEIAGSYHHSLALNKIVKHINTPFALSLDGDFYCTQHNWIDRVIKHMKNNNLAFFGAQWHPKWFNKWRYFPTQHCLFFNLNIINKNDINFLPTYTEEELIENERIYKIPSIEKSARGGKISALWSVLNFKYRKKIGLSRDTSYPVFEKFHNKPNINYGCLTSVFKPKQDFRNRALASTLNRAIEMFLPDSSCYIPKKHNYYTTTSFFDLGYYNARENKFEEFMWRNLPFAFHLRGARSKKQSTQDKLDSIQKAYKSFGVIV